MFSKKELQNISIEGMKKWLSYNNGTSIEYSSVKIVDDFHFVLISNKVRAYILFNKSNRFYDHLVFLSSNPNVWEQEEIIFKQLDAVHNEHIKENACSGYNAIYEATPEYKKLMSCYGILEVSESVANEDNYQDGFCITCAGEKDTDRISSELEKCFAGPSFICSCTKEEYEWYKKTDTIFDKVNIVWIDQLLGSHMSMSYTKAKELANILKSKYNEIRNGVWFFDGDEDSLFSEEIYSPNIDKIVFLTDRKECKDSIIPLFPYSLFSKYAYANDIEDNVFLYAKVMKEFAHTIDFDLYCLSLAYEKLTSGELQEEGIEVKQETIDAIVMEAKEKGYSVDDLKSVKPRFLSFYSDYCKDL